MEQMDNFEKYYRLEHMLLELNIEDSKYSKKYTKALKDFKKSIDKGEEPHFLTNLKLLSLVKTHTRIVDNK